MDILENAGEIEIKGEQLYRTMALESPVNEIKSIFGFLAREENRHLEAIQAMRKHTALPDIAASSILGDSKAEFKKLSKQFSVPGTIAIDREFALRAALEFENKSVLLYDKALSELSETVDNDPSRRILDQILDQEKKHVRLVESLMAFQRHPYEWLENAEWNHLDEY